MKTKIHRRCACGCGGITGPGRRYITGHNNAKGRIRKKFSREYTTWLQMKVRCNNPKNPRYNTYGGRGIRVCIRWRLSFRSFLIDMGIRPEGKTIDRKNNDGNYKPSNCRWADRWEQAFNRPGTKHIMYKGNIYSIRGLGRELNISYKEARRKIKNDGLLSSSLT